MCANKQAWLLSQGLPFDKINHMKGNCLLRCFHIVSNLGELRESFELKFLFHYSPSPIRKLNSNINSKAIGEIKVCGLNFVFLKRIYIKGKMKREKGKKRKRKEEGKKRKVQWLVRSKMFVVSDLVF